MIHEHGKKTYVSSVNPYTFTCSGVHLWSIPPAIAYVWDVSVNSFGEILAHTAFSQIRLLRRVNQGSNVISYLNTYALYEFI